MARDNERDNEWLDYYEEFSSYFSAEKVRDGCHPRILEHDTPTDKAIVLVHGLTDSPYFMTAIGDFFHNELKYNVYMPLLHCHGLKEPKGMEGVKLDEWKKNVRFAVETATKKSSQISIGGLSTGGGLSFYEAATNSQINGTLYLSSAALDLADGTDRFWGKVLRFFGIKIGDIEEKILRTFLSDLLDNNKPLIGNNPYRYCRMDMDGARQLSKLIEETDGLIESFKNNPFSKPVFAAHSESDSTANIEGIEALQKVSLSNQFTFFRIPKAAGVSHASLVLKEPVYSVPPSEPKLLLESANPKFEEMMIAISRIPSV